MGEEWFVIHFWSTMWNSNKCYRLDRPRYGWLRRSWFGILWSTMGKSRDYWHFNWPRWSTKGDLVWSTRVWSPACISNKWLRFNRPKCSSERVGRLKILCFGQTYGFGDVSRPGWLIELWSTEPAACFFSTWPSFPGCLASIFCEASNKGF